MRIKEVVIVAAALALMIGTVPAVAQQTTAPSTAQGKLMRVDATAKTISIETASKESMVFSYSDSTKVTGAGDSVAGLATLEGSDVTVTFTKRGQDNVASQIDVKKKPAA